MRTIDAFAMHFGKKITAHGIGTQATGPAHFQPQTRQADGHIGFGAGCALVESLRLLARSWLIGHEHHHGFADCQNIYCAAPRLSSSLRSSWTAAPVLVRSSSPIHRFLLARGNLWGLSP